MATLCSKIGIIKALMIVFDCLKVIELEESFKSKFFGERKLPFLNSDSGKANNI